MRDIDNRYSAPFDQIVILAENPPEPVSGYQLFHCRRSKKEKKKISKKCSVRKIMINPILY